MEKVFQTRKNFRKKNYFLLKYQISRNLYTSNLEYLTVEQALEDIAAFINNRKKTVPGLKNSKVGLKKGLSIFLYVLICRFW